jgi:hypothetical protein
MPFSCPSGMRHDNSVRCPMEISRLRHPPKYFHHRLQVQTNDTAWQIVEGLATPAAVFELRSEKQLSFENPVDVTTLI